MSPQQDDKQIKLQQQGISQGMPSTMQPEQNPQYFGNQGFKPQNSLTPSKATVGGPQSYPTQGYGQTAGYQAGTGGYQNPTQFSQQQGPGGMGTIQGGGGFNQQTQGMMGGMINQGQIGGQPNMMGHMQGMGTQPIPQGQMAGGFQPQYDQQQQIPIQQVQSQPNSSSKPTGTHSVAAVRDLLLQHMNPRTGAPQNQPIMQPQQQPQQMYQNYPQQQPGPYYQDPNIQQQQPQQQQPQEQPVQQPTTQPGQLTVDDLNEEEKRALKDILENTNKNDPRYAQKIKKSIQKYPKILEFLKSQKKST